MDSGGSIPFSQVLSYNPILILISPVYRIIETYLKYNVIFSSHQHLVLPRGLFPVGVPVKISVK